MKHKRRNFLINPQFQIRFALYISGWMLGLSLMFLLILNEAFALMVEMQLRDPKGPEVMQILQAKEALFRNLYLLEAAFVVLVFIISIFMSHRIAGPLYKLNRTLLDAASRGILPSRITFRSGDYFQELAESYNAMAGSVAKTAPQAVDKS